MRAVEVPGQNAQINGIAMADFNAYDGAGPVTQTNL